LLAVGVVWTEPVSALLDSKTGVFPCVYWVFSKHAGQTMFRKTSYKKNARAPALHAYTRAGAKKETVAGSVQAPLRCARVVRGPRAKILRDAEGAYLFNLQGGVRTMQQQ